MRGILRWGKKQLKILKRLANQAYFSIAKNKVECNICGYKADHLASDPWHLYTRCPHCDSKVRHRMLWATFQRSDEFNLNKIIRGKDILHFAPEIIVRRRISPLAKNYKTADLVLKGYAYAHLDYNIDISNMAAIPDQSFDTVIVIDVLQQVPEHFRAMQEVNRVLRKGGTFVVTVPQQDYLTKTYEDKSITDVTERERLFGQRDHLRMYGDDFNTFLENAGFGVTKVDKNSFPEDYVTKHVLHPPVMSDNGIVTNFRKLYFAVK